MAKITVPIIILNLISSRIESMFDSDTVIWYDEYYILALIFIAIIHELLLPTITTGTESFVCLFLFYFVFARLV